ncbi:SusD/RagB family nutrient-binding outer membrane lipoprotein [Kaistella flava (ex Peng et al. 2021)]|uniref:SusD/RagB family nutrient-binding outer membrane lipoprotein n=1 Tax=Kaistella flava (ex Peng et al. 2021) TaxID=2038776 RepID=A0A7M2YAT4_9FLAO|nr:SusD/RagB family nutrient-binding outer membrane lipoprotein [Kaistella flava (ex Peng et al. 2021)]QOW11388.1 SusD/RagB family nutrient-binding outer membrane lipoprotein [Kaistella flava (ex Peng et al. 2021)]
MKKILNKLIIGALAAVSLTSCQRDLLSLNEDPKHPSVLPSSTLLAMGQQQYFYYTSTGSVNFNNYRFFVQQWAETTYTDETNYDLVTRNQPRNNWNRMYVYSLNNYQTAKKNLPMEAVDTEAERTNRMATLEISQIAVWENLVDTYGNIPYFGALQAETGNYAPKYDDAKAIYTDLLARINAVNATITEGTVGYSSGDLVYGGNMTKWKHFANSIKLRLALNLADTDAATSKSAAEAAVAAGVIASNDEAYSLKFPGGTYSNPLYDDLVASGRNDFVPTELVINKMSANADPRMATWFTKVDGQYVGGVFGSLNPFNGKSHMSSFFLAPTAPVNLLSYEEVLFMKAEAAARGYSVGGTAATFYAAAINASMALNNVSTADAATYLAAHPYDAVNWKKSIGEEAYIAMFNKPFAAWLFARRLDNPVFVNPPNSKLDGVPVRMPYSDQEYVLNKINVTAAATAIGGDKATTKLFWDKF